MKRFLISLFLLLVMIGCGIFEYDKYTQGVFPDTVVNLGDINSADDDYNSTSHVVGNVIALVFSSKRGGRSDFNLVHTPLGVEFDLRKGDFTFSTQPYGGLDAIAEQTPLTWATGIVNSGSNELGPYIRSYQHDLLANTSDSYKYSSTYLMLYASDPTGNLDIYLTHNYQTPTASTTGLTSSVNSKQFVNPIPLSFLNSSFNDAYPTFDKTYTSLYFCSDRGGSFDIYKASLPALSLTELHTRLPTLTNIPIERVANLSSSGDDKCPFISEDRLVFTSNRPGGYGGYDLYYCQWDGERWSVPVNFGPSINTAYDEYRPILVNMTNFSNQLMIFSSNRPGGLGGFDLYRVGVSK